MNKTSTILQSSTAVMGRRDSISQPVQSRSAFLQNSEKTPRFARFFFGTLPSRSALAEIIKQQHNKQLTNNNGKAKFHKTSNITFTW
jgi:hypothetical protein